MYGEEQPKGFIILFHNLETSEYYIHFQEIKSFRYDTIDLDELLMTDPYEIIKYLEQLHESGIDHIRILIKKYTDNLPIIREYFRTANWLKVEDKSKALQLIQRSEDSLKKYKGLEFLIDPALDEYSKFVMYVNMQEGEQFITVEELKKILIGE